MSPARILRATILVATAAVWAGSPDPISAQALDCDGLIETLRAAYVEPNWDNLGGLEADLASLAKDLTQGLRWYSAKELDALSVDRIKSDAAFLKMLRECMPRVGKLLEDIRLRIEALDDLSDVTTTPAPARSPGARGRLIDQLEEEHAKTVDAIDDALRRAGLGAPNQEILR